jgi:rod shape-determining protein MreD
VNKFILPLIFLFLFILESLFVQFLPADIFNSEKIFVPHFLIVAILFLTIFGNEKYGILYGFIFGLLFDIVYTEIIGIYLFLFPLVAYIVSRIMKVLQTNLFIGSFVSLIGITFLEIGAFEMNKLIHITNIDFMSFLNRRLLPTLLLNAIFIIIAAYPLKRQFEKFADNLRAD